MELQLKYASSASQLAQLQPQLEEQQRLLAAWEGRLGRQLEAIVGMQKSSLAARASGGSSSSVSGSAGGARAAVSGTPMAATPQSSGLRFRPAPPSGH